MEAEFESAIAALKIYKTFANSSQHDKADELINSLKKSVNSV